MGLRDYESVLKAAADPTRARILKILEGGEIIALRGDLGAGKTCLTQGLAAGLDVAEGEALINAFVLPSEKTPEAKVPQEWLPLFIAMIPVAVIGFIFATRVWNARARPKAAGGH